MQNKIKYYDVIQLTSKYLDKSSIRNDVIFFFFFFFSFGHEERSLKGTNSYHRNWRKH